MSNISTTIGWGFSAIVAVIFIIGAYMQFNYDVTAEANSSVAQFPQWAHKATALFLLMSTILFLLPNASFSMLGAIVMTGMIGGMIATLLLQNNSLWWIRGFIGLLPWLGLYLRSTEFNNLMSFWR